METTKNCLKDNALYILVSSCLFIAIMSTLWFMFKPKDAGEDMLFVDVAIPDSWDASYRESAQDYKIIEEYMETDWSKEDVKEEWQAVTTKASMSIQETFVAKPRLTHQTARDIEIAQLTENEAWELISNGLFKSYPYGSYSQYTTQLQQLKNENTETITVDVWYWVNPSDIYDMRKTKKQLTIAVNSAIADTFRNIFADIYDNKSKPIINLADKGMGTWVLRGKNHNSNNTMSAHALGCAIDINPSTGSFKVDGVWYGNSYGQQTMSKSMWEQLPECHDKYHVLYSGSPIVEIFKSYGFYWGGDWNSTKDCMHLSYIGDGSNARSVGINNFMNRR